MSHPSRDIESHIKTLYHRYRHTSNIDAKGHFFSPTCLQICRPVPSYSATNRSQIVQYLKDAQQGNVPLKRNVESKDYVDSLSNMGEERTGTGRYTIRPLSWSEHDFGGEDATAAVGLTPAGLKAMAEAEGWVGMRVDLWDEGAEAGLLVKVQYWWRLEMLGDENDGGHVADESQSRGKDWRQALHDIMYLGPRDGTEGEEGLEILR